MMGLYSISILCLLDDNFSLRRCFILSFPHSPLAISYFLISTDSYVYICQKRR
ncbi:MAG: hypothetical protein P857_201 [Candidatus Xenolissoclinum pacificiensis L6]|uniref:Uncharacterized protein n=1 Tax=Candidatus Xenolissoclinum pacificiensis L6 TaxID=1401685 RepID=W2V260_9RICK|nr:MAG: hypothetical protein P857_201 [Candidatus Xenolissoclinum pacificiensis L6]